jgi:hypothetical protein
MTMAHGKRLPIAEAASQAVSNTGLDRKPSPPPPPSVAIDDAELLEFCSIRLPRADKLALRGHFRRKGLGLSTGIRMVLVEYMERERLK